MQVVKLSDAVQDLPRQTTEFVHGVPHSFLEVGDKKAQPLEEGAPRFSKGAYFIGKVPTCLPLFLLWLLSWASEADPALVGQEGDVVFCVEPHQLLEVNLRSGRTILM
jgi:hypothetical protein